MSSGAMNRTDSPCGELVKPFSLIMLERPKSDNKSLSSSSATKTFTYETNHEKPQQ